MVHRAFLLSLILAAVVAPDAHACSCVPPEDVYEDAKVAFTGTVVERTADRTAIDVERVFKGDVSGRVTYKGSGRGASSCDPEIRVGERIGVMAQPGGELQLCNTTGASALERIAQPLPGPDGEGPTAFLVGGSFKEHGVVALDAFGRILRYGRSIGFRAAACPGGRTVVGADGSALEVLRVRDLKVVRRLRGGAAYVRCLDAAGRRIVSAGYRGPLSIWTGARRRIVRVSRAPGPVALGQRRAVFATGPSERRRVMVIDYRTRSARRIHTTTDRRYVYALALSPDERRALVASSAIRRGSELRIVPVGRGGHISSTALGSFEDSVDVVWSARGRILLAIERKLLELDAATLEIEQRVRGWGHGVVVRGGAAYSITPSGALVTPDFPAGEARRLALLPRARVGPLVAVPPPPDRADRASASCRWRGMPRPLAA